MPIRPVWHTRISSAVAPMSPATAGRAVRPRPGPGTPVAALALPEVRMTPAARPPVAARWARLTCTGAAAARLVVKTPAAGTARPSAVATTATSWRLGRLDAGEPPAATNPGRGDAHGYTPAIGRPVVSGSPSATLAHWIAWPDAPFTRLSSAHRETTQPVRGSTRA